MGAFRVLKECAAAAAVMALTRCVEPIPFVCAGNEACQGVGEEALCTFDDRRNVASIAMPGRCSRADTTCPSGRRFSLSTVESTCVRCGAPHELCCTNACTAPHGCTPDGTCSCFRDLVDTCVLRTHGDVWCTGITGLSYDPLVFGQRATSTPRLFFPGNRVVAIGPGPFRRGPTRDADTSGLLVSTDSAAYIQHWNEPASLLPWPPFTGVATDALASWGITLKGELFRTSRPFGGEAELTGITQIVQVTRHCARTRTGDVFCWRKYPGIGTAPITRPFADPELAPSAELSDSADHVCSRKFDGTIWCKGDNTFGQLGGTIRLWSDRAIRVPTVDDATHLARGGVCARRRDGTTWCWGMGYGLARDPRGIEMVHAGVGFSFAHPFPTSMPPFADFLTGGGGANVLCGVSRGEVVCLSGSDASLTQPAGPTLTNRISAIGFPCD